MNEAEKNNYVNANSLSVYFLYSKTKTRKNTMYLTKNKISRSKHILEELKTNIMKLKSIKFYQVWAFYLLGWPIANIY